MRARSRAAFSMKLASRCRMMSSTPPISPAATILQYKRSKPLGCLANESESVEPDSTSCTTSPRIFLSLPGFCCCSRICSDRSSGRPASCSVESWRVNCVNTLMLTPPIAGNRIWMPFFFSPFSFGSFFFFLAAAFLPPDFPRPPSKLFLPPPSSSCRTDVGK